MLPNVVCIIVFYPSFLLIGVEDLLRGQIFVLEPLKVLVKYRVFVSLLLVSHLTLISDSASEVITY